MNGCSYEGKYRDNEGDMLRACTLLSRRRGLLRLSSIL